MNIQEILNRIEKVAIENQTSQILTSLILEEIKTIRSELASSDIELDHSVPQGFRTR